jgi:hypothetical protein
MIPRRFFDALARGDISGRQFQLGCYLAGAVDFRTGERALSLRSLGEEADYGPSEDTLLRDLKALRQDWIEFDISQGRRKPYVFRLTGLKRRSDEPVQRDFRTATPSPAEVHPDLRKSEQRRSPQQRLDTQPVGASRCGSPKEETRRRQDKTTSNPPDGRVTRAADQLEQRPLDECMKCGTRAPLNDRSGQYLCDDCEGGA